MGTSRRIPGTIRFIQTSIFSRKWDALGLDDDDIRQLETDVMENPAGPPVIPGTGGLRKIRFASRSRNTGKSGGFRVGYVYLPDVMTAVFVVYPKTMKDDLSPQEKKMINSYIKDLKDKLP